MTGTLLLILGEIPWEDEPTLDDDFGEVASGVPVAFGLFFALIVVIGIASAIWRVSTARRMARDAGLDEDDATRMALLSDQGLSTTYLASSLRAQQPPAQQPPAQRSGEARPVAERLRELTALRDDGLLTEEEYAERRRAILDDV
ncbi:SHOCT domain-containing protein [Nocardioides ochotonae]|uniref:SHOCT domain-containing protein n=1 Tax=Nocardioides ochotonae TaxID=2685869 RepID=UPI00140759FD|nr:SHOCT domain-containing protein [Nocardioides ochotonae]